MNPIISGESCKWCLFPFDEHDLLKFEVEVFACTRIYKHEPTVFYRNLYVILYVI